MLHSVFLFFINIMNGLLLFVRTESNQKRQKQSTSKYVSREKIKYTSRYIINSNGTARNRIGVGTSTTEQRKTCKQRDAVTIKLIVIRNDTVVVLDKTKSCCEDDEQTNIKFVLIVLLLLLSLSSLPSN